MDFEKAYDIVTDKLNLWLQDLIGMLPNILLAAIVLVIGLWLTAHLKKLTEKLMGKIIRYPSVANLFTSVLYVFYVGIVLFISLNILNLQKAVTSLLAGAGILSLGFAFAFQDIAANFVSGIFLTFNRPLKVGDIIQSNNQMGIVMMINIRNTVIRTFQGQMVIIPNKEIFQNTLINYTTLGRRRIDLQVGISYGEDLEQVEMITKNAIEKVSMLDANEPIHLFYNAFGDSSIDYTIYFWITATDQPTYLKAVSDAIKYIKSAYDANTIMIPFPIRTLDFGIKGGESLSDVLKQKPTV